MDYFVWATGLSMRPDHHHRSRVCGWTAVITQHGGDNRWRQPFGGQPNQILWNTYWTVRLTTSAERPLRERSFKRALKMRKMRKKQNPFPPFPSTFELKTLPKQLPMRRLSVSICTIMQMWHGNMALMMLYTEWFNLDTPSTFITPFNLIKVWTGKDWVRTRPFT